MMNEGVDFTVEDKRMRAVLRAYLAYFCRVRGNLRSELVGEQQRAVEQPHALRDARR